MRSSALLFLCVTACSGRALAPRQIVAAAGLVRVGEPAERAVARVRARLGPPLHRTEGVLAWAARAGNDCYLLELHIDDEGRVAWVDDPFAPGIPTDWGLYEHCAEIAALDSP